MKVLSLFDGMSCGQIALKQIGIIPETYYASEIDKHAIRQTQLNFPNTVQLGDVTKWKEWDINWKSIDLLLAGSPCQGFSFAGKQLAFDDPRSKLFFVFIDILNHIRSFNPDVLFLLENVNMKRSHMQIISEFCGVFPVNINSNLVSAQNRDRWYWSNIRTKQVGLFGEVYTDIPQPEDKDILLRDILEEEVDEKYYLSDKAILGLKNHKERHKEKGNGFGVRFPSVKSNSLPARCYKDGKDDLICVAMRGREEACLAPKRTEYGKSIRKDYESGKVKEKRGNIQRLEPRFDGKTNCLTSVQKDNPILQRARGNNIGGIFEDKTPTLSACAWEQNNLLCTKKVIQLNLSTDSGGVQPYQQDRVYDVNGISPALCAGHGGMSPNINIGLIRRLTPIECSRLQTIPGWYIWQCSETQIYKMLGNGWTVDVIVHILSFIREKLNINVV